VQADASRGKVGGYTAQGAGHRTQAYLVLEMTRAGQSFNPFRTLVTHRNFRLFWIGQTLSQMGTWMQSMALGWLALELTDDAFLVTLVGSIGSLPVVLLSLHAGAVADRVDKLKLVTAMQALMLVQAVALWWLAWTGHVTIVWLFVLAAIAGLLSAFEIPARQAMLVDLVGRDDLHDAIALNSSGFNLARIVGPAIGALVIRQFGLAWCFAANALSYIAVLAGLLKIRIPPLQAIAFTDAPPLQRILEGLRYMTRTTEVRALMSLVAVYSIFGVPYLALMPVVARDLLHTGASGYGILLSFVGVGGVAGALVLAALGNRVRPGRVLNVAAYAFAVMLIVFSLARSEAVARVLLLLVGFTMIINNALANGILQSIVRDEFRGRVMAVYSLVVVGLSSFVGYFGAGAVARLFGVSWAIGGAAVVMLLFTAWTYWRYPEMGQL
jgi:MFS family permease